MTAQHGPVELLVAAWPDAGTAGTALEEGEDDGAVVATRAVIPAQRATEATTDPVGEQVSTVSGEEEP